jgi:hypothetical protein
MAADWPNTVCETVDWKRLSLPEAGKEVYLSFSYTDKWKKEDGTETHRIRLEQELVIDGWLNYPSFRWESEEISEEVEASGCLIKFHDGLYRIREVQCHGEVV